MKIPALPRVSIYCTGGTKRALDVLMGGLLFLASLPLLVAIGMTILLTSGWPVIFTQVRTGKKGKSFVMYKFRTMYVGADGDQDRYRALNEATGPVFKIQNDPRFVGIGRWLSRIGLDELPQLVNVLSGEMSLVGPRPLPITESQKLPATIRKWRQSVKPGLLSEWAVSGTHTLSFDRWMELDKKYITDASLKTDICIILKAVRQCSNALVKS